MTFLKTYGSLLIYILPGAILIFLTMNRHSRSGYFNYHSELWADKGGYYVYLPATFKYGFDASRFPQNMDKKNGDGFKLDTASGLVHTKYTYGVALMELPFYLAADFIAAPGKDDGFSPVYHKLINVAAVFYFLVGIDFLNRFLAFDFNRRVRIYTLAILFLGTNLFFFTIDETGMSHIYSFCAFAAYLFFLRKTRYLSSGRYIDYALFGLLAGLIAVLRPVNIIFLPVFFFLDAGRSGILPRCRAFLRPLPVLTALLAFLAILAPQAAYWHYLSGRLLMYSYGDEGFNWLDPRPLHYLFSPNNGMLLYTPLYLIILAGLAYGMVARKKNGRLLPICFMVLVYVFSTWWCWWYGCTFGARAFVEYLALFSIPLAWLVQRVACGSRVAAGLFGFACLLCIAVNLKLTYAFDECFFGTHNWDWASYWKLFF